MGAVGTGGPITTGGGVVSAATVLIPIASLAFDDLIQDAKDLIEIHARLDARRGRRRGEMSLNRGAVVLAVAAWQAYVEELARSLVDLLAAGGRAEPMYRLVKADVFGAIRRFNTPNARNTVDLLARTGFDPSPGWSFDLRWAWARLASGRVNYRQQTFTPAEASDELDAWLLVRHRIAHGDDFDEPALRRLLSGTADAKPSLRRADAERCVAFLHALARSTEQSAMAEFSGSTATA